MCVFDQDLTPLGGRSVFCFERVGEVSVWQIFVSSLQRGRGLSRTSRFARSRMRRRSTPDHRGGHTCLLGQRVDDGRRRVRAQRGCFWNKRRRVRTQRTCFWNKRPRCIRCPNQRIGSVDWAEHFVHDSVRFSIRSLRVCSRFPGSRSESDLLELLRLVRKEFDDLAGLRGLTRRPSSSRWFAT